MKRWLFLWGFLLTAGLALGQAEPYRLRVLSWSCKAFPRGVLAQGVVRNVGSRPLADLRVSLRVVGPGLRVATASAPLADRNLTPGESARFELRMRTAFEGVHRCELWFRNPRVARIPTLVPNPR
ncbi:MAG: FxLYD domain-containing protein [Meiothermus sp.]|uniref:FxLYD domain-containing protein n=1 Tax=Meiothermus sp. TaxID=1955249 RepID=UPI00298EDFDF|nr:FxLYD domain-containing protein [Meiothermus sp.]MDW8090830.1 FxLYD domain-containing protein [Meiothermus sp.]